MYGYNDIGEYTLKLDVVTLDEPALATASRGLIEKVLASPYKPTHIVAIASGGLHVAKSMVKYVGPSVSFFEVRVQRPSTESKRTSLAIRILPNLPYLVTDRLRLFESYLLERLQRKKSREKHRELPESAAAQLARIPAGSGARVLVVDDAVDSGSTLYGVLVGLRHVKAAGGEVRSAVLTVTHSSPLARPDYYLFERVIFRFPWSYDFRR